MIRLLDFNLPSRAIARSLVAGCLVAAAAMLGGCAAPVVSTRVTSFQQWPVDVAGQTYAFAQVSPEQAGNLEFQTYRDIIRAGLSPTGLVEAKPGQAARFVVDYQYGVQPVHTVERQIYDPGFYNGFYGPPWWGGPYWGPSWIDVPVVRYRNWLRLQIRDASRGGAEVYRSSAYTVTDRDALLRSMPYLVRALFDHFPGQNGEEHEVEYPLSR
jgi:hypothetical protein